MSLMNGSRKVPLPSFPSVSSAIDLELDGKVDVRWWVLVVGRPS